MSCHENQQRINSADEVFQHNEPTPAVTNADVSYMRCRVPQDCSGCILDLIGIFYGNVAFAALGVGTLVRCGEPLVIRPSVVFVLTTCDGKVDFYRASHLQIEHQTGVFCVWGVNLPVTSGTDLVRAFTLVDSH